MKRTFLILTALLLLLPASALAKGKGPVYVPPNQSAASQYTEDVPTAGGAKPTSSVHHPGPGGGSGGSGGSHGGGSASGGSGAGAGQSAISSSTLRAMSHAGASGAAAAAVAQALAPSSPATKTTKSRSHRGATSHRHTATRHQPVTTPRLSPSSAPSQVIKTLSGSDAGSGIGVLLPIILIGSLVLAAVVGLARFLRPGPPLSH